jgi:hypothetical protein
MMVAVLPVDAELRHVDDAVLKGMRIKAVSASIARRNNLDETNSARSRGHRGVPGQ